MALFQPISSPDSHFLQKAEFLQLPLMVKDEAVTAGPPASQVLLSPDIGYRGVQHTPAPSLHACGHRHTAGETDTQPLTQRPGCTSLPQLNTWAEVWHPPGLPASATRQRLSS